MSCDLILKTFGPKSDGIYYLKPTSNAAFAVKSDFSNIVKLILMHVYGNIFNESLPNSARWYSYLETLLVNFQLPCYAFSSLGLSWVGGPTIRVIYKMK